MRATVLLFIVIYCSLLYCSVGHPIWKVFCTTQPLYRGRADPIVDPGKLSQHGHKIWGGNNFGIGSPNISALDYFDHIRASSCTTCSITIDLTDYWIPDLYYQWPNGSLSLVPNGGLTVYYLSRGGSGDQTNPNFQPFPAGLRMTSGSPWRRTYSGTIKEKAISYACLGGNIPEVPYFPTNGTVCSGGLRAQVWFPMCWDGKNLDAPDHQSHMSHPIERPDGGNCPATHPVRLPGVFFEILFDVNNAVFPHGTGENPFVWANGDKTGYGLHGDFLNGWDTDIVRQALADPMCDLNINPDLAFGNNVKACPPLAPYVKDSNPNGACKLSAKIPTFEDVGLSHTISHMPGCNPITSFGASVTPCWDAPTQVGLADGVRRVLLKSNVTSKFVTSADAKVPLTFNINENDNSLAYSEVFVFSPVDGGLAFFSEGTEQYVSGPSGNGGTLLANRGGVSDWEKFALVENDDGTTSIVAQSNKKYVSLQSDGTLRNSAATIGPSEKFTFVDANGKAPQPVPDQNVPDYLDSAQPRAHAIAPVVAVLALLVAMLLH